MRHAAAAVPYTVGPARPRDLAALSGIELAAARMLAGHAPASVLTETTHPSELRLAQRLGLLWIARAGNEPVGFAHAVLLEPRSLHLAEIDVHPDHGRRGLGTRLVGAVCAHACASGFDRVTLTTFRAVPWNMPFYAKVGFRVIAPADRSAALRAVMVDEARRGLDPAERVAMRFACAARTHNGAEP